MGLIKAALNSAKKTLGDQWAEFMVLPPQAPNVLIAKGIMRSGEPNGKQSRVEDKGSGAISDGTRVSVPEGYAFLVTENGAIKDVVFEAGEYTWDTGTSPSVLSSDGIFKGIVESFKQFGDRVKFGGQFANEQYGVYVRLTEVMNNKFGTPTQMAYNDARYGNIYIRSFGRYTFRVSNPITLIANVTGLTFNDYLTVDQVFDEQLKSEFVMNLVSSMSTIGRENDYPFDMFLSKSKDLSVQLAGMLTEEWSKNRGLTIVSVAIEGIEPDEESKAYIREVDKAVKVGTNQGYVTMKQLEAMNKLAENEGGGTPNMFMGMGMGSVFGQNMQNMGNINQGNFTTGYQNQQQSPVQGQQVQQQSPVQGQQVQQESPVQDQQVQQESPVQDQQVQQESSVGGQTGETNTTEHMRPKFCPDCGTKFNGDEKFCPNCGRKIL